MQIQKARSSPGWLALAIPWRRSAEKHAERGNGKLTPLRQMKALFMMPLALAVITSPANAQLSSLADMTLEQLSDIEVTSVSRRAEPLTDAAASIFVISSDDIRRSGARTIPEILRLAPNLHVARVSASTYAISARGFNNSSGNKLLVMIDGRSVYSPLFSGVFWDVQDQLLEDIERIEVISGPGGTTWGTNAVNGIINIITRSARHTQGGLLVGGMGEQEATGTLRYGGSFRQTGYYRAYGKYYDYDNTTTITGEPRDDDWHKGQVGFRFDWGSIGEQLSVQGDAYRGTFGQPRPSRIVTDASVELGDISVSGVNLTARWDHILDDGSEFAMQAYYDRTKRDVPPTFAETLDIFDVQILHSMQPIGMNRLVWGAEYRYGMDRVANSQYIAFLPGDLNQTWMSAFVQNEMMLQADLRLTLGARLERNDYTGTEFLPSARLAWKPAEDHLVWSAISRAVRAPSRLDRDTYVPGDSPYLLAGGSDFRSEIAYVFEVGYRGQPAEQFSYLVTAYYADYDYLRSQEIHPSGGYYIFGNEMEGRTRGIEMWGSYQALDNWRLSAGLSLLDIELRRKPNSTDPVGSRALGNDPDHKLIMRSILDITPKHEFDVTIRRVGELPNPVIPAYTVLDTRFGWQVNRDTTLSLIVENVLDKEHAEFAQTTHQSEYGRNVFLKLDWLLP